MARTRAIDSIRLHVGGQTHAVDFHYVGLCGEFRMFDLSKAAFVDIERVDSFGTFDDASSPIFKAKPAQVPS